ncbi:cyclophilin-like fold protein [Pseudomonas putida]|uniref:cyclophilin-like fold protein n=2 Tax=Pseudomonas TaxID=286 RepID=UPI00345C9BFE
MALGLAHAVSASASDSQTAKSGEAKAPQEIPYMQMSVGERHYKIRLADTEAARAFSSLIPLTLEMADLNSNEKYVDLAVSLPKDASVPGTIKAGDVMLYGSKTLVVFYKTFKTPYSYTLIGNIENPDGLMQMLGSDDIRVVFSITESQLDI